MFLLNVPKASTTIDKKLITLSRRGPNIRINFILRWSETKKLIIDDNETLYRHRTWKYIAPNFYTVNRFHGNHLIKLTKGLISGTFNEGIGMKRF